MFYNNTASLSYSDSERRTNNTWIDEFLTQDKERRDSQNTEDSQKFGGVQMDFLASNHVHIVGLHIAWTSLR